MRTRSLLALLLLTLCLMPSAAAAGELSRATVQRAPSPSWGLSQFWAEIVALARSWSSGSGAIVVVTGDASSCTDPDGRCGLQSATADGGSCPDPNGRCGPGN